MARNKLYSNIIETTFDTPLVKLNRLIPAEHAAVLLKLEFFNPYSSVKDRIGRAMIEAAEKAGIIRPETRDHRAHEWQHGHCPGLCRRRQRIPPDTDDAGVDERGTAGTVAGLGGQPRFDAGQGRHERGDCQGPGTGRGDAQ